MVSVTDVEGEYFPVVSIVKETNDPTNKKPYKFSISNRYVSN